MRICNEELSEVGDSDIINGEFIIPNSVRSIGDYAFYGCYTLTSIVIPNSVTSIGDEAFYGCYNLTSITIGNSVKSIGDWAFADCYSLTSVTIGNSVTSIGDWAFKCCSRLKSIIIPDSVTSIGDNAFHNCGLKTPKKNYKAFKLVKGKLFCCDLEFKENEKTMVDGRLKLYRNGLHFCTNLFEIFDYYHGEIDKDIAIYECEIGDKVLTSKTSKCCTNWIIPRKRLYRQDVIRILNGEKGK